jgi:hypothetical protein
MASGVDLSVRSQRPVRPVLSITVADRPHRHRRDREAAVAAGQLHGHRRQREALRQRQAQADAVGENRVEAADRVSADP